VLSKFTEAEKAPLREAVKNAAEAAQLIAGDEIDTAMNRYSK
jgi:peptidyl-tRNA hydrolase